MKIGILTYHRTLNYGACLQAVATRIVLEKMGHEVYYVDYWPEYHRLNYSAFSFAKLKYISLLGGIKYLLDSMRFYKYRKQRIDSFEEFFQEFIYPYCKSVNESFDVIVYGSDQIWRKQGALNAYNPVYFGINNFKAKKHVAYAGSMGNLPTSESDFTRIKSFMNHMDKISVRERDLQDMLHRMGYNNVPLVVDPTLLLTKAEWDSLNISTGKWTDKKYMLLYGIGSNDFSLQNVQKYASSRNCELIILKGVPNQRNTNNILTTSSPESFIDLIKNAECIFTSSFHGLAFSIIYEKEFYASFSSNSNRAVTLLERIDLKDRLIAPNAEIPFLSKIQYNAVKEKLEKLRVLSVEYLSNSLV